ncbi:ABC transporter ATP-binding protein [bacterium]|nr:ABC transporter ATP-binding protein [bacterium]
MAIIKCENLHKSYPTQDGELNVLRGIDFEISNGDFIAIVGASGVGKSTLLHLLGLLDMPSAGTVFFNEIPSNTFTDKKLAKIRAKTVGFVFQFHHLMPEFTALENLLIPQLIVGNDGVRARKRAMELLDALGISNRAKHFPSQLSGGEQQRVALARAFVNNPKIILADEPTGNLDDDNSHKFMQLVQSMRQQNNIAFILATHNMQMAKYTEHIFHIKNGKLFKDY